MKKFIRKVSSRLSSVPWNKYVPAGALEPFSRFCHSASARLSGNAAALKNAMFFTGRPEERWFRRAELYRWRPVPLWNEAANYYRQAAERNHVGAMLAFARCLECGLGVESDPEAALVWESRARAASSAAAFMRYGDRLKAGRLMSRDEKKAEEIFHHAQVLARQLPDSSEEKAWVLGRCLLLGLGEMEAPDEVQGAVWLERAAKAGVPEAQFLFGAELVAGNRLPKNAAAGRLWLERASTRGFGPALCRLAACMESGVGGKRDVPHALKLVRESEAQKVPEAVYLLGLWTDSGLIPGGEVKSMAYFQQAADAEEPHAQFFLSRCAFLGQKLERNPETGLKWLQRAAMNDFPEAQFRLGMEYFEGRHIPKNEEEAVRWFELASRQRHAPGMNALAWCLEHACGVEPDTDRAKKLYRLAAEAGNGNAQFNLGLNLISELSKETQTLASSVPSPASSTFSSSVPSSLTLSEESLKWLRLAEKNGILDAAQLLNELEKNEGSEKNRGEKSAFSDSVSNSASETASNVSSEPFSEYWLRHSAAQGNPDAWQRLGVLFYSGKDGLLHDEHLAAAAFRRGADLGQKTARYNLACCFRNGCGTKEMKKEEARAFESFRLAALQGLPEAQFALGRCFSEGRGTSRNLEEAVRWYELSARQGFAPAQLNLGIALLFGNGITCSKENAVKWLELAAGQHLPEAQYLFGVCLEKGLGTPSAPERAVEFYRQAASRAHVRAQYALGRCTELGVGTAPDRKEAFRLYKCAADQGLCAALMDVGRCFHDGTGTHPDVRRAFESYKRAAEQNDALAQDFVALCYDVGSGVGRDMKQAVSWYRKAAEQNVPRSQYNLAVCLFRGLGIARDTKKALEWLHRAAKLKYEPAISDLNQLQGIKNA